MDARSDRATTADPHDATPASDAPGGQGSAELVRRDDAGRYELRRDGAMVAYAAFQRQGSVLVIPHTEVNRPLRGQGIGAELVAAVLDDVRSRHEKVLPLCWYVRQFIDENPSYRDLVASRSLS
jgi:predicted GNAT family acetyltransferase